MCRNDSATEFSKRDKHGRRLLSASPAINTRRRSIAFDRRLWSKATLRPRAKNEFTPRSGRWPIPWPREGIPFQFSSLPPPARNPLRGKIAAKDELLRRLASGNRKIYISISAISRFMNLDLSRICATVPGLVIAVSR